VGDKNDGFRHVGGQSEKLALEFGTGDGIECTERFVHEEDGRVSGQGAGHTDALALATGKLSRITVRINRWGQADRLEDLNIACRDAFRRASFRVAARGKRFHARLGGGKGPTS
jgi:hypothetical protein